MEVSSWENHRTKWVILQQIMFDYQGVRVNHLSSGFHGAVF